MSGNHAKITRNKISNTPEMTLFEEFSTFGTLLRLLKANVTINTQKSQSPVIGLSNKSMVSLTFSDGSS
jgi:hypothetical protein